MNENSPEEKVYFTDVTQAVIYTFIIQLPTYQACHKRPQQATISTVNFSNSCQTSFYFFTPTLKRDVFVKADWRCCSELLFYVNACLKLDFSLYMAFD